MLFFLLIVQGLVFGFFCSYIAKEKNRDGQSWFWLGFFFSILAVLALIAVPKIESDASITNLKDEDETKNNDRKDFTFEGERNIENPSYQLFLTRQFTIEKNLTLEKYTIENDVFNTLDDSLREADIRYSQYVMGRDEKKENGKENSINSKDEKAKKILIFENERMTNPTVKKICEHSYTLVDYQINGSQKTWIFKSQVSGHTFELNTQRELDDLAKSF